MGSKKKLEEQGQKPDAPLFGDNDPQRPFRNGWETNGLPETDPAVADPANHDEVQEED